MTAKLYSYLFIALRTVMLVKFARQTDHPLAILFAVSEGLILIGTIICMRLGEVDKSVTGYIVPLAFCLPLTLNTRVPSVDTYGPYLLAALLLQVALRLFMGTTCTASVPVYRRVISSGPFAIIRHPLSLLESVIIVLMAATFPSPRNTKIAIVTIAMFAVGVLAEEKHLYKQNEYRTYAQRVRWRWVPGIW